MLQNYIQLKLQTIVWKKQYIENIIYEEIPVQLNKNHIISIEPWKHPKIKAQKITTIFGEVFIVKKPR